VEASQYWDGADGPWYGNQYRRKAINRRNTG
jgi:hypothetical protein